MEVDLKCCAIELVDIVKENGCGLINHLANVDQHQKGSSMIFKDGESAYVV